MSLQYTEEDFNRLREFGDSNPDAVKKIKSDLQKELQDSQSAEDILSMAGDCLVNRAQDRDTQDERSMGKCVAAFNALYDKSLTTEQGWQFMVLLKMSRATVGGNLDDYVDQSAYSALAGEEAMK